MPVKQRRAKRRNCDAPNWATLFETGWDFFHDLDEIGITTHDQAIAAAPEAWARLGDDFLAHWVPTAARSEPWALEEFGPPKGVASAR